MSSSTSLLRVSGGASTSAPSAIVDVVGAVGGASRRSLRRTTALSLRRRPTPTLLRYVAVAASGTNDDRASLSSSPFGGGLDPSLELAVPKDQRPSNELASLKTAPLYSWVSVRRERGWKRENIVADALFLSNSTPTKTKTKTSSSPHTKRPRSRPPTSPSGSRLSASSPSSCSPAPSPPGLTTQKLKPWSSPSPRSSARCSSSAASAFGFSSDGVTCRRA